MSVCASAPIIEFLGLVNMARKDRGLGPLYLSPELMRAATVKATAMASGDWFSHTEPGGRTPKELAEDYGYPKSGWVGENILWGYSTPEIAFDTWWNSAPHRENILHPSYRRIGVALNVEPAWDYEGDIFAVGVTLFGTADTGDVRRCRDAVEPEPPKVTPPDGPRRPQKGRGATERPDKVRLPNEKPTVAQKRTWRLIRRIWKGMK